MQKGFVAPVLILLILLVLGGFVGFYFLGKTSSTNNSVQNTVVSQSQLTPTLATESKQATIDKIKDIVPINESTISFTNINNNIRLRYKGIIYEQSTGIYNSPQIVNISNQGSYTWYGLVDSPIKTVASKPFSDELFDFKVFPDLKNFMFIMRWGKADLSEEFKVFYYLSDQNKLLNPPNFERGDAKNYNVPKINQISQNGQYVAFSMFGCWNCGGHQPETLLLNLVTNSTKRIGKVSLFNWKDQGGYEYKDYIVKECSASFEGPGQCSEDPKNLPLKTGQF